MESMSWIKDDLIRTGVTEAITRTLQPALRERKFPGHFLVEADGKHFGTEWTFPGLDAWEITGAYLLMGESRAVLDYFDFVQASQRADGHIPFAVLPAEQPVEANGAIRNIRYPEDVFEYEPVYREGRPEHSELARKKWIGLFEHWVPNNPLGVLGPVSFILIADEIVGALSDTGWLREKILAVEKAGRYVLSCKAANGLIDGAGFYVEMHSRHQWDGVTQCYAVHAFRRLAGLHLRLGNEQLYAEWQREADEVEARFQHIFWQGDHYAEYMHPEHGLVDFHGLTDVNWAAVAFGIANPEQAADVWNRMTNEPDMWRGDFPKQLVAKAYLFQPWELHKRLPFEGRNMGPLHDVAAMGRVWYLEAMACLRMNDTERLAESVRLVCRMGERHGWQWYERYQPLQTWDVHPTGAKQYCEYAAILVRIVLGNKALFEG